MFTFLSTWQTTLRRGFLLAVVAYFALLNVQYVRKVSNPVRSAILRWRTPLLELGPDANIWDLHNYPNPPIMALLLKPFAHLSPLAGAWAWFAVKAALAAVSLWWMIRMLQRAGRPIPFWGAAILVALCARPIEGDLMHGNVNLFILFLMMASLNAFQKGCDLRAGLFLGLSIACKLTPALFLPYFIWKRAWGVVAGTGLGLVLFLSIVPSLFLGWQHNHECLASWTRRMVVPFVVEGKVTTEHQNQSLPGVLHRLLTTSPSFSDWVENNTYVAIESHNFVDWPTGVVNGLVKACLVVCGLLMAWRAKASLRERNDARWLVEFGLVALGMLLFCERTWKHHCVILLLPLGVMVGQIFTPTCSRRMRFGICGILTLAVLAWASTSTGWADGHDRFGKLAQVYGAYMWANVLLAGALLMLTRETVRANDEIALSHVHVRITTASPTPQAAVSAPAPCSPGLSSRASPLP